MTNLSSLEIANAPTYLIAYPGSIVDISQLQYMLKKAEGYGYKKVGFILDRGYFGRENIQYMDECGYDFVIMVKGMSESVRRMILENKGEFENMIIPGLFEPPVRTLRATIPENESHIFR